MHSNLENGQYDVAITEKCFEIKTALQQRKFNSILYGKKSTLNLPIQKCFHKK